MVEVIVEKQIKLEKGYGTLKRKVYFSNDSVYFTIVKELKEIERIENLLNSVNIVKETKQDSGRKSSRRK